MAFTATTVAGAGAVVVDAVVVDAIVVDATPLPTQRHCQRPRRRLTPITTPMPEMSDESWTLRRVLLLLLLFL